jgi:hypothetical protein
MTDEGGNGIMKKLITIIVLLGVATLALAHPPKEVALSWDPATKIMTIKVTHLINESKVTDPTRHYVKELGLTINGKVVAITNYKYQQFPDGETIAFELDLKSGDKVTATAKCSLAGQNTGEYTVE